MSLSNTQQSYGQDNYSYSNHDAPLKLDHNNFQPTFSPNSYYPSERRSTTNEMYPPIDCCTSPIIFI